MDPPDSSPLALEDQFTTVLDAIRALPARA